MSRLTRAERELLDRDPQLVAALRLVLDDEALAAAVERLPRPSEEAGARARPAVRRLRYKPGGSILAAVEVPGPRSHWYLLAGYAPAGAPKLEKDRLVGRGGALVDEDGGWLLAPALSDRRIRAGTVVRARRPDLLAYNPRRRLVLREPVRSGEAGLGRVLKVYARETRRPSRRTLRDLAAAGVPLAATSTSPNRNVHVSAWMPGRHAEPARDGPVARAALDRLNRVALPKSEPTWDAREVVARAEAATESIAEILPAVATPAVELARRLAERLPGAAVGPVGSMHGDFSPDQLLVDDDEATLVDLDDCATGPLAWDAATWLASQLAAGVLDAVALPGDEPAPELYAAALALRVVEPFRRRQPAWDLTTARLLDHAHAVLDGAGRPRRQPTRAAGPAPTRRRRQSAKPRPRRHRESGLSALLPPLPVTEHGEPNLLRRAWPDGDRVILELVTSSGRIGVAHWRPGQPRVQPVAPADDAALPGLAATLAADGMLVGHRLGKRAVVRTSDGYAKVVRPSRAAPAAARHAAVRTALASVRGGPAVPDLLGVDEASGVLRFAAVPGQSLEAGVGAWEAAEATKIGRRLGSVLRSFGTARLDGLPTHDARDEGRVLGDWAAQALGFDLLITADRESFEALVCHALNLLAALDGDPQLAGARRPAPNGSHRPRPLPGSAFDATADTDAVGRLVHRDLHLGQVLGTRNRLGLLDLDTAALGDPALDVGNLLAHLDLEVAAGRCAPAVAAAFVDGLLGRLDLDGSTVAAYRASTLARLVAVHAFRPDAARLVPALLASAGSTPGEGRLRDASHVARAGRRVEVGTE